MTKVIGIDPAPSKKSTVYSEEGFQYLDYKSLQIYLSKLENAKDESVIICWDAPLSFGLPDNTTYKFSPFYTRKVEYFFSSYLEEIEQPPQGISVLGYAGCSHWAISQYMLGYPKLDRFIDSESKFTLLLTNEELDRFKSKKGRYVTEVHPALAIWLWCRHDKMITDWKYKKNKAVFNQIIKALKSIDTFKEMPTIKNDDELDAYIAWKLGNEWISGNDKVKILGDKNTGSFLLPYDKTLFETFKQ